MIPATSDGQSMQVANSATSTMKSSPLRRGRSVRSAAFLPPQVVVRRWTKPRLLLLWWRTSWRKWKPIPDTFKNCFERRPLDHRFRLLVIHPCFVCFVTHQCAPGTTLLRQVKGLRRTTTRSRIRSWNRNRNNHKDKRRSQVEDTNKQTISHLASTPTSPASQAKSVPLPYKDSRTRVYEPPRSFPFLPRSPLSARRFSFFFGHLRNLFSTLLRPCLLCPSSANF